MLSRVGLLARTNQFCVLISILASILGHVIALDSSVQPPKTIWKTKLPSIGGHPIHIAYCPSGAIYCGAYDYSFKLNAADGAVMWKSDTERICSVWPHEKNVLVGHNGYLTCLSAHDGKRAWQSNLKGAGWATVNICVLGDTVYAACKGELYAFKLENGEQVWHDNLKVRRQILICDFEFFFQDFLLLMCI
jgi:outer membrane protein assembly factor BamB